MNVPHKLTPRTGSRVIFFSSSLTRASGVTPNYLLYISTKGAIEQMARALAKDLGGKGINVNTVSPGPIDTDLFRNGKPPQLIQFFENLHPAKRLGQPEEVAKAVAFMASEDASWVNGQTLMVNGVRIPSSIFQPQISLTVLARRASRCNVSDV